MAAGAGTRLRDVSPVKPLALVLGRPLILHVLDRLGQAGIEEAVVVTGYEATRVEAALRQARMPLRVCTVHNQDWQAPNGVSVLAAAPLLHGRALLTMSDHLVDPTLYRIVGESNLDDDAVALGIDRRIGHPWIDEEDVTRVATAGDRIIAIGKHLTPYDAYDTGVFNIGPALISRLARLPAPSLSDGMRLLAEEGKAVAVDIGNTAWLDVDDGRAFHLAEDWLADKAA